MNSEILVGVAAVVLFIFTFLFSYAYSFIKSIMRGYDYIKCLTGGFIIGIILMEVLPDIYVDGKKMAPVITGLSFFLLFSISKLYIERASSDQDSIPTDASRKEALIFILALSLHSFMEGLGVSGKKDSKLAWYLVSILVHKWLEAIVLGASVLSSSFSRKTCFFLLGVYSSLTSIGALIGRNISYYFPAHDSSSPLILQLLDGIAAGSFFYIGFVEMVGNEFETSSGKLTRKKTLLKTLCMFTGYFLITSVICLSRKMEEEYL